MERKAQIQKRIAKLLNIEPKSHSIVGEIESLTEEYEQITLREIAVLEKEIERLSKIELKDTPIIHLINRLTKERDQLAAELQY